MKQFLLLILAIALSTGFAKADDNAVTLVQIGNITMPSDSVQHFMPRDTIFVKATWNNTSAATAATVSLVSCTGWATDWASKALTLDHTAGEVDTFFVVNGSFPVFNFPEGKNNVQYVQVKVTYGGDIVQPYKQLRVTNDFNENRFAITQIGTVGMPAADSLLKFDKDAALRVKVLYTKPEAATAVSISLVSCTNWANDWKSTNVTISESLTGLADTLITIPEDFPVFNFPEGKNNVQYVQVKVSYPEGDIQSYDRVQITGEGVIVESIEDYLTSLTCVLNGDTENPFNHSGWTVVGDRHPGDVFHLQGTYEVEKNGHKATKVSIGVNDFKKDWSGLNWNVSTEVANEAKANLNGIIDHYIRIPNFFPTDLLITDDASASNQLLQVRVTYDDDTASPIKGGIYSNFWMDIYAAEETPSTCMGVGGIQIDTITHNAVTIDWEMGNDAAWDILVAEAGSVRNPDAEEGYVTTYTMPFTLPYLEPGTDYEMYVRSVCNNDTVNYQAGSYSDKITFTTKGGTSVTSFEEQEMFKAYPNPVNNMLNISADNLYNVDIIDLSGRVIISTIMSNRDEAIDVSELHEGFYIISLSKQGKTMSRTFIKK